MVSEHVLYLNVLFISILYFKSFVLHALNSAAITAAEAAAKAPAAITAAEAAAITAFTAAEAAGYCFHYCC